MVIERVATKGSVFLHFSFLQVFKRFDNKVPLLDPIDDLKIKEKSFKEIVKKNDLYEKRMKNHPMHKNPERKRLLDAYQRKDTACKDLDRAKSEVKKAKSLLQVRTITPLQINENNCGFKNHIFRFTPVVLYSASCIGVGRLGNSYG